MALQTVIPLLESNHASRFRVLVRNGLPGLGLAAAGASSESAGIDHPLQELASPRLDRVGEDLLR